MAEEQKDVVTKQEEIQKRLVLLDQAELKLRRMRKLAEEALDPELTPEARAALEEEFNNLRRQLLAEEMWQQGTPTESTDE